VTKQTESAPRTATAVKPDVLTALNAYSVRHKEEQGKGLRLVYQKRERAEASEKEFLIDLIRGFSLDRF
jgi:hypothetical protein